ncbi:uncharacterized protein LOC119075446 [Bradysia coprophila]|uniref:uncharacterized protein LOC119075446 n=1 Tax=Bradysia coprophila TaxID=38358 RepID=UPI00187DA258|nr:uncharacterized protein LOC119075446 [Bradysia coprophila]
MENKPSLLANNTQPKDNVVEENVNENVLSAVPLNSDCIQEIFHRVKNLKDFLSLAQVSKQFAENATATARHRKQLFIGNNHSNESCFSIRDTRHSVLLQKFGHLVDSIVWCGTEAADEYRTDNDDDECMYDYDIDLYSDGELLRREDDGLIFQAIIEYCGTNLKTLDTADVRHNQFYLDDENKSSFPALEEIRLSGIEVYNEEMVWLKRNFPKLEKVRFKHMGIADNDLIEFLEHNHQIRSLELFDCYNVTPNCRNDLVKRFPSMELSYFFCRNNIQIRCLQNLTSLNVTFDGRMLLRDLLDHFAINNVPLKHLTIYGDSGDGIGDSLAGLKMLKSLSLMKMSGAMLVQLAENLPVLESIIVRTANSITVDSIKQALQCGRCLKFIQLCGIDGPLDLDGYNSILALARGHTQIKEMSEANREWINLSWCILPF